MKQQKKVFVYGDFNILHPGHLRLLKFAKESGDYLTVGVNSDKNTNNKNILNQEIRLDSVKATSYVDEAFIIDESPLAYIQKYKPHIVVKGREHENRENPEIEMLKTYGGKLLFTSGEIGFSSLDLLQTEFSEINSSDIKHSLHFLKRHAIEKGDLTQVVEQFHHLNVLVVGDTIVDEYITCNPVGMSQEDPTIVVTPLSSKKFIGGAAIVAAHAKTLGAHVTYISVMGEDENFLFTQQALQTLGVQEFIETDPTRPTTLKQRFRAQTKTLLRVNHLKQHQITKELEEKILLHVKQMIATLDLIILSDFSYGVLTKRLIDTLCDIASSYDVKIVADSQSSSQVGDISKFPNMTLLTPTEREIRLSLNDFESGLVVLSQKLFEKSHPRYIFTTLGEEGVMIYNSNDNELLTDNIPALNRYPKDVSGAGDSMLTCTAMSLCIGADIWKSAYLGSLAAAIQVSRVGNVPIQKNEILCEIDRL